MITDSDAVAVAEPEQESEILTLDDSSDEDEPPEIEEVESPKTAAQTSLSSTSETPAEPFLKPVPNPSEIVGVVGTVKETTDVTADMTPIAELTTREQEVFMLMAHGDTNADIAEELFISEGTVKTHVKRVLSKLYIRDRTQVVVFAYEKRLVVPGATEVPTSERRLFGG